MPSAKRAASYAEVSDWIYQRVMTYAAVCAKNHKPREYIPHMATWLNEDRFLDDPGEWAVSGAFMFSDVDPSALAGKSRAAFRGGFLGVASLGWSTLVQIVEATQEDRERLVDTLARQLYERLGAPDLAAARAAAEEEIGALIVDGVAAIQAGDNPRVVQEKLGGYLAPAKGKK